MLGASRGMWLANHAGATWTSAPLSTSRCWLPLFWPGCPQTEPTRQNEINHPSPDELAPTPEATVGGYETELSAVPARSPELSAATSAAERQTEAR